MRGKRETTNSTVHVGERINHVVRRVEDNDINR